GRADHRFAGPPARSRSTARAVHRRRERGRAAPAGYGSPLASRRACRSSRRSPNAPSGKSTAAYASAVPTIRPLLPEDWPAVEAIWAEGIDTRNATFETETPSWESFDASRHATHRHVALGDGRIVGWAALSPVSR